MAIQIQPRHTGGSTLRMIMILVVLGVLGFATYYLFFAPTPAFDDFIIPASLQQTTLLSKFELDPNEVLESPEFKSLAPIQGLPTGGSLGRPNPFLPI